MARAGSFENFFELQHAGLVRYAALLAGSTAQGEDLAQEVLVRMYLRWDQLAAGEGNVLAYARRAIINEHVSWRRRWSTRHIHPAGDRLPDTPVNPWHEGPDEQLWLRLQALPARPRAALIMRFYQDLTDAEIAEALDCRPGTVRAHISRGLAALRIESDPPPGSGPAWPPAAPLFAVRQQEAPRPGSTRPGNPGPEGAHDER